MFFFTGLRVSSFLAPCFLNPSGAFKSHVLLTDSGEEPTLMAHVERLSRGESQQVCTLFVPEENAGCPKIT